MLQGWEYLRVRDEFDERGQSGITQEELNDIGRTGWELMSAVGINGLSESFLEYEDNYVGTETSGIIYVFKRPSKQPVIDDRS